MYLTAPKIKDNPILAYLILINLSILSSALNTLATTVSVERNNDHASKRSLASDSSCSAVAAGFLFAHSTDKQLDMNNPLDQNLSSVLDRDGPEMRPSRGIRDFNDISLNVSIRAWDLMHEHASIAVERKVDAAWPVFESLMKEAKTTKVCVEAVREMMAGATRMESWAIQMLNSWGGFPMNRLFEGTYGDLGSYDTCVSISDNKYIDHAHYCSVLFRPVMPSTKDYELIVRKEPEVLRHHFERKKQRVLKSRSVSKDDPESKKEKVPLKDAFTDLLENAQYHHYVYYKIGTCWPISCSPFDIKRLVKLIGRKSILMNGPIRCFSRNESDYELIRLERLPPERGFVVKSLGDISAVKANYGIYIWKPHLYLAHKIAFSIVGIITTIIIVFSIVDLCINRAPSIYRLIILSVKGVSLERITNTLPRPAPRAISSSFAKCADATNKQEEQHHQTLGTQTHPTKSGFLMVPSDAAGAFDQSDTTDWMVREERRPSLFMSLVDDFSIITSTSQFFHTDQNRSRSNILCLNGIRCITMAWIILTHTMMYNDWAQFARTRTIEVALNSILSQPFFNGSYLVDTFFLISGLLTAYTSFRHSKGIKARFNSISYLVGRWLRLTPQILFVAALFILLPLLSDGPFWYPMVGEYSENCMENWWVNMLHLQSFYRKEEMCNFVTWWISIDFFYHTFALAIIWILMLGGHRPGFLTIAALLLAAVGYQSYRHYDLALPPNLLSTLPQTGKMWSEMTLDYFWTPYTHAVPFLFGFYTGYLMALKRKMIIKQLSTRMALLGWTLTVSLLICQSLSTFWWVTAKADYSRSVSTLFHGASAIVWSGCFCWIIIACEHGYGGFVNRALSSKVFIILSKSSYCVYLAQFIVLFLYFGSRNVLLEPDNLNLVFIVLGTITMSTVLGTFLSIIYETPWLKMQRRLMKYL